MLRTSAGTIASSWLFLPARRKNSRIVSPKQTCGTGGSVFAEIRPRNGWAARSPRRMSAISTSALSSVLEYESTRSDDQRRRGHLLLRIDARAGRASPDGPARSSVLRTRHGGRNVAANVSGPRRRLYGSARDMVIGMTFATLEGKLMKTGGMVVKNVAGLDMGKLMIGSFGTLAAIATVNFRMHPMPPETRTFIREFREDRGSDGRPRPGAQKQAAAGRHRHSENRKFLPAPGAGWRQPDRVWTATRASSRARKCSTEPRKNHCGRVSGS